MSSDDEERFTLRDKIALEILTTMCNGHEKSEANILNAFFREHTDEERSAIDYKYAVQRFESIVRTAYKMADIVRKIRISSFE
jgi:hypothetical protein